MRTSFNQPEAQPPNFPARRTGQPQYPIYRDYSPEQMNLKIDGASDALLSDHARCSARPNRPAAAD